MSRLWSTRKGGMKPGQGQPDQEPALGGGEVAVGRCRWGTTSQQSPPPETVPNASEAHGSLMTA